MRSPSRRRSSKRKKCVPPDVNLEALAERVTYVGSPEHKDGSRSLVRPGHGVTPRSARASIEISR